MTFRFLPDEMLEKVQDVAIELGFAGDAGLTAGIRPAFVSSFATGNTDVARLMTLTTRMNLTRALVSGEVPFIRWLKNAIRMAAGSPEELVFRAALEMMSTDGATPPAAASPAVPLPQEIADLPREDGLGLEIVIEQDDTIDVAFLHTGADVSRSVAKLEVRRHFEGRPSTIAGNLPDVGLGTGWVLAPNLLITNWHVVNARLVGEGVASDEDFGLQGVSVSVLFDFYDRTRPTHRLPSAGCVAWNKDLDYAVLRLPNLDRPPLRLRTQPVLKPASRALKERVNVLQHPGGEPMRLGFRNNFVVTGTADRLSYLTDTAGGSSGSPICDDAWLVAALHRGFRTIPGDPVDVWGKQIRQENFGTPIGRIVADLAQHHPAVHAQLS